MVYLCNFLFLYVFIYPFLDYFYSMKSETYKYQRYLSAIFIIKLIEVLFVMLLFCNAFFYNFLIKKSVFFNSLFLLIFIVWYGIGLFKKYSSRFNTFVTFDNDIVSVRNGSREELLGINKNLEIWVLASKSTRYQQYSPFQNIKNNALIIVGNHENFKNKKIIQTRNTTPYDNNIQHLEESFGRGYISIIYREPLRDWLNLYNKQIYRDQFPVASYKYLRQQNNLSQVSMHH